MRKHDEAVASNSCWAKAHPDEMVFVLLGRDPAAPHAIRAWTAERIRLGKNSEGDAQTRAALACAMTMEKEGRVWAVSDYDMHNALKRIAAIIEAVDMRAASEDGSVRPTLQVMTQDEISRIYALAKLRPEEWRPA